MAEVTNEAKVSLMLDINNALKSVETLQKKLDNISIKNIKAKEADGLKQIGESAEKATQKIKTTEQALRQAENTLKQFMYENRDNAKARFTDQFKALTDNVKNLTSQLNWEKTFLSTLNESKEQARINKENQQVIKESERLYASLSKAKIDSEKELARQKQANQAYYDSEMKATRELLKYQSDIKAQYQKEQSAYGMNKELEAVQSLLKYQQETKNNYKSIAELSKLAYLEIPREAQQVVQKDSSQRLNVFQSYSAELSKLEKKAAYIYHQLNNPTPTTNHAQLRIELEKITKEYEKLNRESVRFRQQIGISQTRGIYDLNHNLDYFRSKVRSRLVYSFATELDNMLLTAPQTFVDAMSAYQQNKVNFAQVLPEDLARNQAVMNGAMREFIQIASDYGTAVNEVVEAGRLWGRQYKDISIVQELVRNSTKLSITDNMSLTEVNKGLEATMQQYNIHLKDVNEAQRIAGKIVDTWAKSADNAVVTAQDMAKANERSAGAAYQAGIGFDYLQAMIATMSAATGKAGGEIGRSIRSMLVSMRSAKAEKEFAKLGIATKELVNGELRVRSFEKVIDDLMTKLRTTPKDVSNVILAMSGGKFQYTNVMAFLKNQEQFRKNLEMVRDSEGWADEQVARQYETISRQFKALNADLQQFLRTLDNAGVDNGIVGIIQQVRELIQALQGISPEMVNTSITSVEWLLKIKAMGTAFSLLNNYFVSSSASMSAFGGILNNFTQGTITGNTALRMFGITLLNNITNILTLIPLLITLAGILSGLHKDRDSYYATEIVKDAERQVEALEEFKTVYAEYKRIIDDSTSGEETRKQAVEDLIKAQNRLKEVIGEEAYQRIHDSNDVIKAIDAETQATILQTKVEARRHLARQEAELETTRIQLEASKDRIEQNRQEFESNKALLLQRLEMLKASGFSPDSEIAKNLFGISGLEQDMNDNATAIEQETNKANDYIAKIERLQTAIGKIKSTYKQSDIAGGTGGTTEESKDKETGKNYTEQTIRNQLERERNVLWYQGKIEAQAYENALQEIVNLEQAYGTTEYSINQKSNLFVSRKQDLEEYRIQLEMFRDELMDILDNEMSKNQAVANAVGYKTDMTLAEKLQHIEVSKELYQQEKTYSAIVSMISSVNAKIEETKGKTLDVTNSLLQQEKVLHNQIVSDINQKYQLEDTMLNRPTNYNYENQKVVLQIAQEKELIAEKNRYIDMLNEQLTQAIKDNDTDKINAIRQNIATETLLREQQYQKLAELENQKNYNIRNGLADLTQAFLIEGNSLRDIWNNLWQDLAREAIQRLLKVKATASLLGSLFGLFGGGSSTTSAWTEMGGFTSAYGIQYHNGANVSAYPKMHNGGVVASGRIGVVPQLKNDEVVRTLQVGEEVNSLEDRRTNEMLTAIVLKALDGQNARPNNFNIMALDSKTFAEYLNDNADVLVSVLNKQGALGRR